MITWTHRPGDKIMASISYSRDYVISHRKGNHVLSFRTDGFHEHLGVFKSSEEAKEAANNHAQNRLKP